MKKVICIESNNIEDIEVLYNEYYNIKNEFKIEKIQTISLKLQIEIEAI